MAKKYSVLEEIYSGKSDGIFAESNFRNMVIGQLEEITGEKGIEESISLIGEPASKQTLFYFDSGGFALDYSVTGSGFYCVVNLHGIRNRINPNITYFLEEMIKLNALRN